MPDPKPAGLTVGDVIDTAPISPVQRTVFALCIVISLLDGFDTQAIAFVAPAIAKQWAVTQWHFGFIFSATLLGSVIGSALFGLMADRIGRRKLVIITTAIFGIANGACALAGDYWQLLVLRFVCGLGLGGVIPNMLALTAEYAPGHRRATIVTYTLWGFPFGAVLGGLAAGPLIRDFGWPSVFWLGAAAPLLLVPLLIVRLPESLRFLTLKPNSEHVVRLLLRRIDPVRADRIDIGPPLLAAQAERGHFAALFKDDLAAPTVLFGLTMFSTLFLSYLLINWVPTMLTQAGMSVAAAILGAVALNSGGIAGSALLSRAVDGRARPAWILAAGYGCGAIVIAVTGRFSSSGSRTALALLALCGFFHIGSQLSTTAYLTAVYPVHLRGSGVGINQAIGRCGSLIGPVVGGALLSAGFTTGQLFRLAVIPALVCAVTLVSLGWLRGRETPGGQ